MPIVDSMAGQVLDDVYVIETTSAQNIQGIQTGIIKMVGTFTKGIPGAVYSLSDYATAVRKLGPSTAEVEGPLALQALINQKAGGLRVVPVFGSSAAAASLTIEDSETTPGNVLILTVAQAHPTTGIMTAILGTNANQMVATVANSIDTTFDLTISYGSTSETYTGLTIADMVSTINAASAIVIASLPTSVSSELPKAGTYQFSGGLNGTAADADFIGTIDGSGKRTGLKALEPITGNLVFAANQNSTAINTALGAHGNNYDCIPLVCAPINSAVAATVSANTLKQDNVAFCDGWRTMYDSDTGTNRNIAPTVLVAGMAAQLAVHKSWGNKAIYGTLAAVTTRSTDELKTLQQGGILCVCDNIPRGGVGTRSGIASDGSDIYVRRMRYYLEISVMSAMGWAVDEMQSSEKNDPLRKDVKQSVETFLSPMANPIDPKNKMIDSYLVVCDLSNNPADQVAAGKLSVNTKVRLLGTAKTIIIYADISQSTITTSSQAA
jgi:hypothetical protein